MPSDRSRFSRKVLIEDRGELFRSADKRAKLSRSRQVVTDAITGDSLPSDGELALFVEDADIRSLVGIGQIELLSGQPFIQKPRTAGVLAGRFGLDPFLDDRSRHLLEKSAQYGEVKRLVPEGEFEMGDECIFWPVSWRQDTPPIFLPEGVLFADGHHFIGWRHRQVSGSNQRRITGRTGPLRQGHPCHSGSLFR